MNKLILDKTVVRHMLIAVAFAEALLLLTALNILIFKAVL